MSRATTILSGTQCPTLLLIKYPHEQTATAVLRYAIKAKLKTHNLLLISLLHPPSVFLELTENATSSLECLDLSSQVTGYSDRYIGQGIYDTILSAVSKREPRQFTQTE